MPWLKYGRHPLQYLATYCVATEQEQEHTLMAAGVNPCPRQPVSTGQKRRRKVQLFGQESSHLLVRTRLRGYNTYKNKKEPLELNGLCHFSQVCTPNEQKARGGLRGALVPAKTAPKIRNFRQD